MSWFIDRFEKEWNNIAQAPLSFLLVLVLISGACWVAFHRIFKFRISLLQDENQALKDRLNFGGHKSEKYSGMTNSRLRDHALEIVGRIRQMCTEQDQLSRTVSDELQAQQRQLLMKSAVERSPEQNEKLIACQQEWLRRQTSLTERLIHQYKTNLKVDVVLIQEEMLSRIPLELRRKFDRLKGHSEHIVNPIGASVVADDLEKLAKTLP